VPIATPARMRVFVHDFLAVVHQLFIFRNSLVVRKSYFLQHNLVLNQKQPLTAALAKHPEDFDLEGFIQLRYFSLIQQGFNETHFDVLVDHFIDAMDGAWVDESATRDAVSILKLFRRIFERNRHGSLQKRKEGQRRKLRPSSPESVVKQAFGRSTIGTKRRI
jgi:hypothetical protein